jgi:rubrerythrin
MPQTPPLHFLVSRKLSDSELAQAIRLDIEAELDAINLYQSHIDATDNETAKKVLAHIAGEEREHASLFWALLRQLDAGVVEQDKSAELKVRLLSQGATEEALKAAEKQVSGAAGPAASKSTEPAPRQFTVGSLRGRSGP